MSRLVRVADGAYPQTDGQGRPDYSFLPPDVGVWAGYLGGHTPHAWTLTEIDAARRLVGAWWGIWTAPDSQALTAAIGQAEGAHCLARLIFINYPVTDPVFLDVEHASWAASPSGADQCFAAFAKAIGAGGYRNAHWYSARDSHADWRADWTGSRPPTLPSGVVGIQYDHALDGDRYDISVFDLDKMGAPPVSINGPEHWDDADRAKLLQWFPALAAYDPANADNPSVATVLHVLEGIRDGAAGFESLPRELAEIKAALAALPPGSAPAPTYSATITLAPQP